MRKGVLVFIQLEQTFDFNSKQDVNFPVNFKGKLNLLLHFKSLLYFCGLITFNF